MSAKRLYFVAAEPSGDLLAAEVIKEIQARDVQTEIAGIGGAELAKLGIDSPMDTSELAILGVFEGLKAYGRVVKLADEAADAIVAFNPDSVILVDSWGFMLRVAQRLRKRAPQIKLIKLVGPQVWATRPGRAKTLAATVDHLLCIHEMEQTYYEPHGLPTTIIGNPALARGTTGDGTAFRSANCFAHEDKILLVLPGSRQSEIKRVAPALVSAAKLSLATGVKVVIAPAPSIQDMFDRQFPDVSEWATVHRDAASRYDAMAAADIALACSGTVTTEVAMQNTPMIVAYHTGWITWAIARGLLYKKTHITLLNIAHDDMEIVPEFVQTKMVPVAMAAKVQQWLADPHALQLQKERQRAALKRMGVGGKPAAEIAADVILEL